MLNARSAAVPLFFVVRTRISQSAWSLLNTVTLTIESATIGSVVFAPATIAVFGTNPRPCASKQ